MSDVKPYPERRATAARMHKWITRFTANSGRNDCWLWTGSRDTAGYGQAVFQGRRYMVHRLFFEFFIGPIPEDMEIDHVCRKRNCVNPFHMEVVNRQVNMERAIGVGHYDRTHLMTEKAATRTKCKSNHALTPDNTYYVAGGYKMCRTCALRRAADARKKRKAAEEASRRSDMNVNADSIGRL